MAYIVVRHKVQDYAKWKTEFDAHKDSRMKATSKGGLLLRNSADPNEVLLLMEFGDLNKAKDFIQSSDLKERMMKAGVIDKPDFYFIEQAEKFSS